jgi:hypothetical protein
MRTVPLCDALDSAAFGVLDAAIRNGLPNPFPDPVVEKDNRGATFLLIRYPRRGELSVSEAITPPRQRRNENDHHD